MGNKKKINSILEHMEMYTAGRLKRERVHMTVDELQNYIDQLKELVNGQEQINN